MKIALYDIAPKSRRTPITREQLRSLKILFRRKFDLDPSLNWREFRLAVMPEICGDGAVMIDMGDYWVGIEPDGYAHS